eukprot:COSAG02_NODE_2547_length_8563_cov_9.105388_2_plen_241_part_00
MGSQCRGVHDILIGMWGAGARLVAAVLLQLALHSGGVAQAAISGAQQQQQQQQQQQHEYPRLANCWGAGELTVTAEQWDYLGFPNVTNDTWADYDLQYINPSADWRPSVIPDWVETIQAIKRRNPSAVVVGTFHTTEVWWKDMIRNGSGQTFLPRDCVIRNADGTACDWWVPWPNGHGNSYRFVRNLALERRPTKYKPHSHMYNTGSSIICLLYDICIFRPSNTSSVKLMLSWNHMIHAP